MPSDPIGRQTLEVMGQAEYYNKWLYSQVRPWISGRVAEAGAGTGNFLDFFLKDKLSITAIDINSSYLHQIVRTHPKVDVFQFDLQSPSLPAWLRSKFDTAIAMNVLEHIPNINRAIDNLYSMLKPGGKIIILVPAFNFAYSSLDRHLGHVKRYTHSEVNKLLKKSGFTPLAYKYINPIGLLGWIIAGKVLKKPILTPGLIRIFDLFSPAFLWIEKYIRFPIGLSVICIAKKA